MKNRDFIRLLQMADPDDEVMFEIGTCGEDKEAIAKASLCNHGHLRSLEVIQVTLYPRAGENGLSVLTTLWSDSNLLCIDAEHFNDIYVKKQDE